MISAPQLKAICPNAQASIVSAVVGHLDVFAKYSISDPTEICHFLAHVACETAGMTTMEENLHYSAARLVAVFPSHFDDEDDAQDVVDGGVQAIANRIYGGRIGNVHPGDGWLFHGRGLLDLTGRETYTRTEAACHLDLVNHPELASDPAHALDAACGFWAWKGCGAPARRDDIVGSTQLVQGGTGGLADRKVWLARVKASLLSHGTWGRKPAWKA